MIQHRWKTVLLAAVVLTVLTGCAFAGESSGFTFVAISDVHIPGYGFAIGQPLDEATLLPMHNQQRLQQAVRECLAMNPKPAFVINCGDTGDAGWTPLLRLYQKLMQPLLSAGMPVYTTVGNHDLDYAGIGRQDLAEMFDPLGPSRIGKHGSRYSFEYGGCHFAFLNDRPMSGLIRLNPEDIAWLRADLKTVRKTTRVLLFMHADLPVEDTHHIVELLQPFRYPVIFQGHAHEESIGKWGGIPVVVTGALYGGEPKAGSYRVFTVTPDRITVRTRDFDTPTVVPGPESVIAFPVPGPQVRIVSPKENGPSSGTLAITVKTSPAAPGTMEYSLSGIGKWTPMTGGNGTWEAGASLPDVPGRYLLAVRFQGENGSVTLAHRVFTISGGNAREVWGRELGAAMQGAPVLWRNTAIVPTVEGGIYSLRLEDGRTAWHRPVSAGQIVGRMAVEGDRVFYGAGRTIGALDAKTGKLLWQTPVEGTIIAGLIVDGGKIFAPAGERALVCLDALNGKALWSHPVRLPIIMEAAAANGRVFFGAMDGYVRALDASTGAELWKNPVSSQEDIYTTAPFWPPTVLGDKVVVSKLPASKDEKNLLALSASDGSVIWSRQMSGAPLRPAASPSRDRLYTLFPGGLQCLAASDGSEVWNCKAGTGMYSGIADGNRIIFRDNDRLCCVDDGGKVLWTYKTSTGPQGSYYGPGAFAVAGDLVIAGTMDGRVMAVRGR